MNWNTKTMQNFLFLGVFLLFFLLVVRLFAPFLTVILWASILYILLNPLHSRLSGEHRAAAGGKKPPFIRRSASAALIAFSAVLLLVVPLGLLGVLLAGQSVDLLGDLLDFLDKAPDRILPGAPPELIAGLKDLTGGVIDPEHLDLKKSLAELLRSNRKALVGLSTRMVRNVGSFGLSLAFTLFTLYFFLMDGPYLKGLFVRAIPIRGDYMAALMGKFRETSRRLVGGNLLVALIQGTLAFILFSVFRIKGALLLGVLVSVCSFIPLVGSGIIWLPVSLWNMATVSPVRGILLLILSALLISIADNFYRPFLVGGPINIHPLPIFFAIVGGVALFGINGLVIGPLILVLFFTVLDLFRDLYKIPREEVPADTKGGGVAGTEAEKP